MKNNWFSNGKFLITGEYLVIVGAKALALPLNMGQNLIVEKTDSKTIAWEANKPDGLWFRGEFDLHNFSVLKTSNHSFSEKLQKIFIAIADLSDSFIETLNNGVKITTNIDFNPEFGMGSSSTLISNLAWWSNIDPYKLLKLTFGGSGYDIACARNNTPLIYSRNKNGVTINPVEFNPVFSDNLYFVYLGSKQSSYNSITAFEKKCVFNESDVRRISEITEELLSADTLSAFEKLIDEHEVIMSRILNRPTVKDLVFSDFHGSVKSMGAWGGDMVLVTSDQTKSELQAYLATKGLATCYKFKEIIL